MATPLQRRASQAQRTPGSKSFCRTPQVRVRAPLARSSSRCCLEPAQPLTLLPPPQPALTPNDDASERASVRRQRCERAVAARELHEPLASPPQLHASGLHTRIA